MQVPLEIAIGWSTGSGFALARSKEKELKQGKSYYMASMCQAVQVQSLSNVISELSSALPNPVVKTSIKIGAAIASNLGFVMCPTFAAVRQGHYEEGIKAFKAIAHSKIPTIADCLPEKLSKKTVSVFSYLAEHGGNMASSTMLVGTVALLFFGNVYFTSAMLVPIAYQSIDSWNMVPRKVSLFMENYLPTISSMTMLAGGGAVMQMISLLQLTSYFPSVNRLIDRKVDRLAIDFFKLEGASLEEIDAPLILKKELSFAELNAILDCADASRFTINPAHCSKWTWGWQELPKNNDFSKLLELFERVDWSAKYFLLKRAFKDDDRFLDVLKTKFPGKLDYQENFDTYITIMAEEVQLSKEKFLAAQLKLQMRQLIKVLLGHARVAGLQKDAEEAILNCSQILHYLLQKKWSLSSDRIEIEDTLLKLSIEGGEYCARGVKRASGEILSGILQGMQGHSNDPLQQYELQLGQAFEFARMKIMNAMYQQFIGVMVQTAKSNKLNFRKEVVDKHAVALAQDVHVLDIYRHLFALGFIPLTDYERNAIGIVELITWTTPGYRLVRMEMYKTYQKCLGDVIKELGALHFFNYMRLVMTNNSQLSEEQRAALIEKFTERNQETWSAAETETRFQRLVCVMLGVLNYDPIGDDWVEITPAEQAIKESDLTSTIKDGEEEFSDWVTIDVA